MSDSGAAPSRPFFHSLIVVGLAAILGLCFVHARWRPNTWLLSDGLFYLNTARAVLERGTLRQEGLYPASWTERDLGWNRGQEFPGSGISLGPRGEWWPKHPVLMPLAALPWIWALGSEGTLLFQWLVVCLLALFTHRLAARVAPPWAALAASAAVVCTPFFAGQAWGFNNDAFSALLAVAALDLALCGRPAASGILLGAAIAARPSGLLYAPALALWFALARDWRGLARGAAAAAAALAPFAAANWYMYGSPFVLSYQRVAARVGGRLAPVDSAVQLVWADLLPRLRYVLFGEEHVLARAPLLLIALAALLPLCRGRRREAAVLGWALIVPLVFFAAADYFRLDYLLAQISISAAPLAALFGAAPAREAPGPVRWRRVGLVAAVALSLLLAAGLAHRLAHRASPNVLWERIAEARAFRGDVPCDLFHFGYERWECRGPDTEVLMTTGRLLERFPFAGRPDPMVLLAPSPGAERRLEYSRLALGRALKLRYGFADLARPDARVRFTVLLDGEPVVDQTIVGRRVLETVVDTASRAGRSASLTLQVFEAPSDLFGVSAEIIDPAR